MPTDVLSDLIEEDNVKHYGERLYRDEKLQPVFSKIVTPLNQESDAYRSMIVLDGSPDKLEISRSLV